MSLRKNASLGAIANYAGVLANRAEFRLKAWDRETRMHQGLDGGTWNSFEFNRAQSHRDQARVAAQEMREIADHLLRIVSK